jgi:hypothetical protein
MLLSGAIGLALLAGAPMSPDQIEELFRQVRQPMMVRVLRKEDDAGDGPGPPDKRSRYR